MALLRRIGNRLMRGFEISGYDRAGRCLRAQGYRKEAEDCFRKANEIRGEFDASID